MPDKALISIEKASPKDDGKLKKIGMTCYQINIDPEHRYWVVRWLFRRYFSKKRFAARRKNGVLIYCLKKDGMIAGFYELEKNGLLSSLYVMPAFQKEGFGKLLLKDAMQKAKDLGMKEMRLDASEFARDFYLQRGFEKNGDSRTVLGVTMIPLKIKIS